MPSEKPSIVNLINSVSDAVNRHFPTIAINLIFPEKCLNAATALTFNFPKCDLRSFQHFIAGGEEGLKLKCKKRADAYNETVNSLLDACSNGNL